MYMVVKPRNVNRRGASTSHNLHHSSNFAPSLRESSALNILNICKGSLLPSSPLEGATHPPPPFPRLRGKCLHALLLSRGRRHFSLKPASYRLPPRPSNQNTSNYSINTILDYLHSSEAWFLTFCVSHFLSRL